MPETPLKVCLVSAAYRPYPSGVSEHVHHLAEGLRDLGNHVSILTTNFPGEPEDPVGVRVHRIGRALRIPLNRSYATLPVGARLPDQVREYLHAETFDIVHCHGMFWPEIAYWALRHSRSVNLITALMAGFRIHTAGSGIYQRLFRAHSARIDGRIAISRRAREAVEPYLPGEYRIIPSGVDVTRFHPGIDPLPPRDAERLRILYVGRLDARKGVNVLLQAMPAVVAAVRNAHLVVVGDGPLRRPAARTVSSLGLARAVTFEGVSSAADLPRYYAGADVYCSPALGGESLGIVLLEAMASGAPVVASDIPGYDETARDGLDALLVTPADPSALAAALARVLSDRPLAQRIRAAGLERARGTTWQVVSARTVAYYRELLAAPGARNGRATLGA